LPTLYSPVQADFANAADDAGPNVAVRAVGKQYATHPGSEHWALCDVSFDVRPGQAVAVLGRNGSGKSTLLQIIAGTLPPTRGEVEVRGRIGALLELGSGFNAELTGRQNIIVTAAVLGVSRSKHNEYMAAVAAFADIGQFIDQPVKLYSSGMFVRLAFAVQACIEPEVFIVDEALGVGDLAFQYKCIRHFESRLARGHSLLLASHDVTLVRRLCQRAVILDRGRAVANEPATVAVERYLTDFGQASRTGAHISGSEIDNALDDAAACRSLVRPRRTEGGHGAAEILGLSIEDAAGRPRSSFHHQQEMVVRTFVAAHSSAAAVTCDVILSDASGWQVWSSRSTGVVPASIEAGRHYVDRVEVTLSLGPGRYFVSCAISVAGEEHDRFANAVEIEIQEFDLRTSEPVPFWGATALPYQVRPLVVLPDARRPGD